MRVSRTNNLMYIPQFIITVKAALKFKLAYIVDQYFGTKVVMFQRVYQSIVIGPLDLGKGKYALSRKRYWLSNLSFFSFFFFFFFFFIIPDWFIKIFPWSSANLFIFSKDY